MKMKQFFKRFFTLNRAASDGFTLVELIVVIAILAVLAGVGVPVYSGYVTKANMQADISLAGEVEDALMLYYYSHYDENPSGYVVITPEGAACGFDEDAEGYSVGMAAMDAVFGDGWENELSLKHDGWLEEGAGDGTVVNMDPKVITQTVGSLTDLAAAASTSNKPGTITTVLTAFCGLSEAQKTELENFEGEDNYAQIATNLMVKYLAENISSNSESMVYDAMDGRYEINGEKVSGGIDIATKYAMLYAMANTAGEYQGEAQARLAAFNQSIKTIAGNEAANPTAQSVQTDLTRAWQLMIHDEFLDENGDPVVDEEGNEIYFADVVDDYLGSQDGATELKSITAAMGAMSDLAAGYTEKETLSNEDLFSSDAVVSALSGYQSAAAYGGIYVELKDGKCAVVPQLEKSAD